MATFASWVAGHSIVPQTAGVPIRRVGWGAVFEYDPFKVGPEQYFHFSIATPTVIEDRRAYLHRVMILFETTGSVAIDRVDLWDGGRGVGKYAVNLKGDYRSRIVDGQNIISLRERGPGPHRMDWGLGVSLHVVPGPDYGNITFTSAGADFG
jgi:hypothetical protein